MATIHSYCIYLHQYQNVLNQEDVRFEVLTTVLLKI